MNLDIYTNEMAKSVWDKAFFMDKIGDTKCIVDFGCADGAMIYMLAPMFPDITFIGYDSNDELINKALEQNDGPINMLSNVGFYFKNEFHTMIDYIHSSYNKDEITINFSSVLHEVFSNTERDSVEKVKTLIKELQPKYITIRDMYYHTEYIDSLDEPTRTSFLTSIPYSAIAYHLFINHFGPINNWKSMLHFLMKSQWSNNGYEQELKENYFSWNINDFEKLATNYNLIFETHYMLPYYIEKWGLTPNLHTHAQFILRRAN